MTCHYIPGLDHSFCSQCRVYIPTEVFIDELKRRKKKVAESITEWARYKPKSAKLPKGLRKRRDTADLELAEAQAIAHDHTKYKPSPATVATSIELPKTIKTRKPKSEFAVTTPEEAIAARAAFLVRLKEGARELEATVTAPYHLYCNPAFDPHPSFELIDSDGEVIKQSDSPWVILHHYDRLINPHLYL